MFGFFYSPPLERFPEDWVVFNFNPLDGAPSKEAFYAKSQTLLFGFFYSKLPAF